MHSDRGYHRHRWCRFWRDRTIENDWSGREDSASITVTRNQSQILVDEIACQFFEHSKRNEDKFDGVFDVVGTSDNIFDATELGKKCTRQK